MTTRTSPLTKPVRQAHQAPVARLARAARLARLFGGELRLLWRYNIITTGLAVSALYIFLFRVLPLDTRSRSVAVLLTVFSDPTMLGFVFTGILILFEQDEHTLAVKAVMPVSPGLLISLRTLGLTLVAVACSCLIAGLGHDGPVNWPWLLTGVSLTSIWFTLYAIIILKSVSGFNQFIMKAVIFTTPFFVPLLAIFGLHHDSYYIFVTHAALLMMQAAFDRPVSSTDLVYAVSFIVLTGAVAGYFAQKTFRQHLLKS